MPVVTDTGIAAACCRLMAAVLTLALLSCGDSAAPTPIIPCGDEQEVTVAASTGLTPIFSWAPACGMSSVQVFAASQTTGGNGWVLYSGARAAENPLGPAIRYGWPPAAALEALPAAPLVAGEEYTVAVYRWIGEPGGSGSLFFRARPSSRRERSARDSQARSASFAADANLVRPLWISLWHIEVVESSAPDLA